jgi:hypothetical protein
MNHINNPEDFVLEVLEKKLGGYYVELGAFHSTQGSTTHKLETEFDWKGVSFEIIEDFHKEISENRKNPCILGDATKFNYTKYFEENNFPKQIDFLQVDIDAGYNDLGRAMGNPYLSLLGLLAIPLNTYRFSVITFEHDTLIEYKNKSMRDAQREILNALGYSLVVRLAHEDWWVDPIVVPYQKYKNYFNMVSA